jgi:serine/threonine-protein kinase HipA
MARRRARVPLSVYLNGRLVGQLRRQSSGAIDFQYDRSWLEWGSAIPVSVSLPLREDRYIGDPVVAVFENLLPDNEPIRRRLAERARADRCDAYSLLAAVGRDCVGALQILPEGVVPAPAGAIDARQVSGTEIAEIVSSLGRNPLGIGDDADFRISIAGAQEKTALLYWKNAWHVPHGTTATTHIFKPQIGQLPNGIDLSNSVENEYLCLKLVNVLGIPAANAEIANMAGQRVLIVERFDRLWTRDQRLLRLPQEDCCQALSIPPSLKYESEGGPGTREIAELLKGSDTPEADQRAFFKAQIVFWMLGATDGHAKNFSIHLAAAGRFRLTPLYDVVSAQPSFDTRQIRKNQMKLAMAIGTKRHYAVDTIAPRHFMQTAELCGLPSKMAAGVFEELSDIGKMKIDAALERLPDGFPEVTAASISQAAKHRLDQLNSTRNQSARGVP